MSDRCRYSGGVVLLIGTMMTMSMHLQCCGGSRAMFAFPPPPIPPPRRAVARRRVTFARAAVASKECQDHEDVTPVTGTGAADTSSTQATIISSSNRRAFLVSISSSTLLAAPSSAISITNSNTNSKAVVRGAAEYDMEYYLRDLLSRGRGGRGGSYHNAPQDRQLLGYLPPPPRILSGPFLPLLLDDYVTTACVVGKELTKLHYNHSPSASSKTQELISDYRTRAYKAGYIKQRLPSKTTTTTTTDMYASTTTTTTRVANEDYFDLTCYAIWKITANVILPLNNNNTKNYNKKKNNINVNNYYYTKDENYSSSNDSNNNVIRRNEFMRNIGRGLYQQAINKKLLIQSPFSNMVDTPTSTSTTTTTTTTTPNDPHGNDNNNDWYGRTSPLQQQQQQQQKRILTGTLPAVKEILDLFTSTGFCESYKMASDQQQQQQQQEQGGADDDDDDKNMFDSFDDDDFNTDTTINCLVSIYRPVTLTSALQISGEGSRFIPDFIGTTLAAMWESTGLITVSSYDTYFVDQVYRPNPREYNPNEQLYQFTLTKRRP